MNGGKVLWFIDAVSLNTDTIAKGAGFATIAQLNIEDQLFRYGVRINPVLLQDVQCALVPVNTSVSGGQPKFVPAPWQYFPLLAGSPYNPVSRNLPLVKAEYASFIDTLPNNSTKKTILLTSSQVSRVREVPNVISLQEVKVQLPRESYNKSFLPVAVVTEGVFTSVFKNRPLSSLKLKGELSFKEISKPTKMLIVADGDLIRNNVKETPKGILISPVGADKYSSQIFGNKEFILNVVEYIGEENNLMQLRTREIKLRLLDKNEIRDNKTYWQLVNTLVPIMVVVLAALVFVYYRKKKYAK
jgi:ABC-2 type transport system permease protein